MKLHNEDGTLNEEHWLCKAAYWSGSHYKFVRFIKILLLLIVVGVILLLIF